MFVKVFRQRRKYGVLFSAILGENERDYFRGHKFIYHRLIASIRETQINNVQALFDFWQSAIGILKANFSPAESERHFQKIARTIPRPHRLVGGDHGIYFSFYKNCHPHSLPIKH